MGKTYTGLDKRLAEFIRSQHLFFVATAPSGADGHVNVSPKGYRDTFAVLGPKTVAYLDLTGSGAETIAHLRQNGRITLMFCSFGDAPKVLRIYGTGRPVLPADPDWPELAAQSPAAPALTGPAATDPAQTGPPAGSPSWTELTSYSWAYADRPDQFRARAPRGSGGTAPPAPRRRPGARHGPGRDAVGAADT
jgi:Pyridoxamine 5'-phosphate oxidase